MPEDRMAYLLQQLFNGESTQSEKEELALWIDALSNNEDWELTVRDQWDNFNAHRQLNRDRADALLKEILQKQRPVEKEQKIDRYTGSPGRKQIGRWLIAAAIAALLISTSILYVQRDRQINAGSLAHNDSSTLNPIKPGSTKAILTLASGEKIILDSADNGSLAQEGNTKIVKLNNQLVYKAPKSAQNSHQPLFNTISTPRGGQFQITLPDGSIVWLNAASSIRFPTNFSDDHREVEMSGEAYFEIKKNSSKPLVIKIIRPSGVKGEITVLGTSFNISAYEDEPHISATLLEGKIRWQDQNKSVIMKPKEKIMVNKQGNATLLRNVNTDEVVAWKNGLFYFEESDIHGVMREIARWYDIDVQYDAPVSAHFMGTVSRQSEIADVLKMLQSTGEVHFEIKGRKIHVLR